MMGEWRDGEGHGGKGSFICVVRGVRREIKLRMDREVGAPPQPKKEWHEMRNQVFEPDRVPGCHNITWWASQFSDGAASAMARTARARVPSTSCVIGRPERALRRKGRSLRKSPTSRVACVGGARDISLLSGLVVATATGRGIVRPCKSFSITTDPNEPTRRTSKLANQDLAVPGVVQRSGDNHVLCLSRNFLSSCER